MSSVTGGEERTGGTNRKDTKNKIRCREVKQNLLKETNKHKNIRLS